MSNTRAGRKVKSLLPADDEIEKALAEALRGGETSAGEPEAAELADIRPNSMARGRVMLITNDQVIVDLKYKSEGIIALDEFPEPGPEIGSEVEAWVVALEDSDGQVSLSIHEANRHRIFEAAADAQGASGRTFAGKVVEAVKGGLVIDIGVRAFMPAREVDRGYVEELETWLGRKVEVRVLEIDRDRERVIVSRRAVLDADREERKAELFTTLEEGQVLTGTVTNVLDFGAFIDIGGVEGLVHRSDLAWGRVGHPSEVVQTGQEVTVTVLSFDRESEKIGLGLKQTQGDSPWQDIGTRFAEGRRTSGKVTELLDFGAVVELEPGIEGLVHVSEMRWGRRVNKPTEVVSIGDEVEIEVLSIDLDRKRLSLSMKKVETNPWSNLESRYPFATVVHGKVSTLLDFGAFITLEDGVEGMVHISELSWTRRHEHPSECLEIGQEVAAIVIGSNEDEQRLSLSIKKCEPDPWWDVEENYPEGARVEGTVSGFKSFGATVDLKAGLTGMIHVSEMGQGHINRPQDAVKIGQKVSMEVLEVSEEKRRMSLRLLPDLGDEDLQ